MQAPLFKPRTEWVQPNEFPDLSSYDEIALDLETKDTNLIKLGPGMFRDDGEIVGISVAVKDWVGYYPIAHEGGGNMDKKQVLRWLKDVLKTPAKKIFHNALYDVGWLRTLNLKIEGQIVDTMIATSLVDENRRGYDLNSVCRDYTGIGKNEYALQEAAQAWGLDPKSEMYKLPAMYVGEYAEKDAEITLALWQELKKEIGSQDLTNILNLEIELFPCLMAMKERGVKVDLDHAHKIEKSLKIREDQLLKDIKIETGFVPDLWAARSVAKILDHLKLKYPRTEKSGAPSFTKKYFEKQKHPVVKLIHNARVANKARTTFIQSIYRYVHKGRIHADINQLRSEYGGTITGRLSYRHPNLQQLPGKGDMGNQLRSIFVPDSKEEEWGCFDYSQQEPRLVVHYASLQGLPGAHIFVDAYNKEDEVKAAWDGDNVQGESPTKKIKRLGSKPKDTDFHGIVSEMTNIPREQAKTINLAKFYGMGKAKMSESLKVSLDKAGEIIKQYDQRVPFVKQLTYKVSDRAQERGLIRTLLGRACRFPLWEPASYGLHTPLPHKQALAEHGPGIKRAFTYKALNKLIQGSAADMTKKAMIELYKNGIIPLIQVHDELDISVPRGDKAKIKQISGIMEDCVKLEVPNKVDYEGGNNWGQITDE
jgi:DNA polymerase I-like protein with 3'-5' exonuclease and polymerase domains